MNKFNNNGEYNNLSENIEINKIPLNNTAPIGAVNNKIINKSISQKNSINLNFEKDSLNFDDILEKRIGFGKYQYLTVLFLCLVDFNDGIELLSMSLILPILKREWQMEPFWMEIITSVFYFGMLIGAIMTGKVSDIYGRRITILIASSIQFLITMCFCFVNSISVLIILRFLYGFIYGFSLPLSISMVSEIIPIKYRGKLIVLTNFCVSIGKIWGIFLAYMTFHNLNEGNWRFMMALCGVTPLLVVIGMYFFVKESPRFLLSTRKYEKAFDIIDHIGFVNFENKKILYLNSQINFNNNTSSYYEDRTSVDNNYNNYYYNKTIEEGKESKEQSLKNRNSSILNNTGNFNKNKNSNTNYNNQISMKNQDKNQFINRLSNINNKSNLTYNNNINNRNSCNINNLTFDDDLEKFNNFQIQERYETLDNNNKKTEEDDDSRYVDPNYIISNTRSDDPIVAKNLFGLRTNCININSEENIDNEFYLKTKSKNNYFTMFEGFNTDYCPLSIIEKKCLINFYTSSFREEDTANYQVLFKENIFPITIRIWICWFSLIFIEFGQYALLPFILISQKSGFGTLLLAIFGEIPAIILSTILIDKKNFGRKNSLSLFLMLLFILNIIIFFTPIQYFGTLISIERFFMKNSFSMLIPLTSELYPTNFRTVGYGFATGMGRVAATICPYLLFPLFYWNALSAFLIFALLSFFALLASYTIPFETSGQNLDILLLEKNNLN